MPRLCRGQLNTKDMKTIEIPIPNLEALEEAAYKFMTEMGDYTVFAFYGKMGAGKTTFCSVLNGLIPHHYDGDFYGIWSNQA